MSGSFADAAAWGLGLIGWLYGRGSAEALWLGVVGLGVCAPVALDLLFGDPQRGHPVAGLGRLIAAVEGALRRVLARVGPTPRREKAAGVLLWAAAVGTAGAVGLAAEGIGYALGGPLGAALAGAGVTWLCVAVRGLARAAADVEAALASGNLAAARARVGRIVGRDTDRMDADGVVRAAVESVAENTTDAVVAPLFFALLGGAPMAAMYRAVNTLDAMVGYRDARYRHLGWWSARMDDTWNWAPARLAGLLMVSVAACVPGWSARRAWRAWQRDAARHPSPNGGIPESVVAGALGIQLGGRNWYRGVPSDRALLGDALRARTADDIRRSVGMLYATTAAFVLLTAVLGALALGAMGIAGG